jgi:hypothetical protein
VISNSQTADHCEITFPDTKVAIQKKHGSCFQKIRLSYYAAGSTVFVVIKSRWIQWEGVELSYGHNKNIVFKPEMRTVMKTRE